VAWYKLIANTYYSELTPASSPWRHVLFVAIVWAAAFFVLNRRAAARLCGAAPGHRD